MGLGLAYSPNEALAEDWARVNKMNWVTSISAHNEKSSWIVAQADLSPELGINFKIDFTAKFLPIHLSRISSSIQEWMKIVWGFLFII